MVEEPKWDVSAKLTILGDDGLTGPFDPAELTRIVGITPTESWTKGAVRNHGPEFLAAPTRTSGWVVRSTRARTDPLDAHARSVLDQLAPGWDPLKQVCRRYRAMFEFVIWQVELVTGPLLTIDADVVARIADLGVPIGLDLYAIHNDEPTIVTQAELAERPRTRPTDTSSSHDA